MKTVGIADLKSRLSEYLRAVRQGHTVTVVDRNTPVAKVVPYADDPTALVVRRPAQNSPKPGEIPLPRPLGAKTDAVQLLLEERQTGR